MKLNKIIVLILGVSVGLMSGYFLVKGVKVASVHTFNFVKNIDFKNEELSYGGPELTQEILQEKTNEGIYFLDYEKTYRISEDAPVPLLTADSYLVGDLESGDIIFSKNENKSLPIASITKLMTAVVADDSVGLSTELKVSNQAISTYGKQGGLRTGEVYTISEILKPLLLESSNDAAEAIAESFIRRDFINKMNDKSKELEMYGTYFGDPSGLSPQNVSTPKDLFKLSQYIEEYRDYIFEITRERRSEEDGKVWFNNSKFRSDDDYYGGKNGYTDIAWKTQLAIFEMNISGESKKVIFIILKTDDIEGDVYGLKRYTQKYVSFE
jgi:D-alanyl-D-alanine carboxypeptidase (penicillin-binding protein 5/6)